MAKQQGPKGRGKSCSRELLKFSTLIQQMCKDSKMQCPELIIVWLDYISLYLNGASDKKQIDKTKSLVRNAPKAKVGMEIIPLINELIDLYYPLADLFEKTVPIGPGTKRNSDVTEQLEKLFEKLRNETEILSTWKLN